jgi:hypothetical protein
MNRPARRVLVAWMVTAMAAGVLLLAPAQAGATTGRGPLADRLRRPTTTASPTDKPGR